MCSNLIKNWVTIQLYFLEYYSEFLNLKAIYKILLPKIAVKQGRISSDFTFNLIFAPFSPCLHGKFKMLSYF